MRKQVIILIWLGLGFIHSFSPVANADDPVVINLSGSRILESALAVADFNGDGKKEIVAGGTDGKVYVVDGATYTVMWEKQMADYLGGATYVHSGITIADLNNDGSLEIVVATGGNPTYHLVGAVIVLTYVGDSTYFALAPGWPRIAFDELGHPDNVSLPDGVPDGFDSTPSVGDLDGDGDLEIVITGRDRRLHAWHHHGTYVAGWPLDKNNGILRGGASSPALADIDKDGLPEIIVGTNSYTIPNCPNPYVFLALNGDGSLVPGFPTQPHQNIASSPAIGDIDGDGWLDIVVGTGDFNESCPLVGSIPEGNRVHAWDHNGNPLPGWPQTTGGDMVASPALGDLDNDGDLEVVMGCGVHYTPENPSCTLLYAWHGDGSKVSGFPMSPLSIDSDPYPPNNAQPFSFILADYDGDNAVEIMTIGAGSRGISIVEPNGIMNPETHRTTDGVLVTTPLVDDLDGDSFLETAIGSESSVNQGAIYIWNETGRVYHKRPWPMFHHDVARTGLYTPPPPPPQLGVPSELRFLHQPGNGETETLPMSIKNLGTGQFDWQITNVIPNVQVYPTSGSVSTSISVQVTLTTTGYSTNIWHYIGDLSVSGTAFGLPVLSSPSTVPIWLYSGDIKQIHLPLITNNF